MTQEILLSSTQKPSRRTSRLSSLLQGFTMLLTTQSLSPIPSEVWLPACLLNGIVIH